MSRSLVPSLQGMHNRSDLPLHRAERRAEEQMGSPKKGPRFVMAQPPCVWNLCWRSTCRMWRRSPDRVSGPHAPSAVAAQQKLHRSSPAVRAAVARVAQDGRGAGRGSSPIAPCQHRCRCSSHTEQGGVVPSMTDQVLGTANPLGKAPIRRSVAPKTSGNDGEADRRSLHVERSEHTTRTRDDTRKRSREALRPPQPGWK
jgi:hypothetical protein